MRQIFIFTSFVRKHRDSKIALNICYLVEKSVSPMIVLKSFHLFDDVYPDAFSSQYGVYKPLKAGTKYIPAEF